MAVAEVLPRANGEIVSSSTVTVNHSVHVITALLSAILN